MKLIIATRKSQLALWQSEHVAQILKNTHQIEVLLEGFKTKGDVLLDSPLAKIGGKGLFTKELEESMLRKEAHLAVHSLKDERMIKKNDFKGFGESLAKEFIAKGAKELLKKAESMI